jgi:hypothetical protein
MDIHGQLRDRFSFLLILKLFMYINPVSLLRY